MSLDSTDFTDETVLVTGASGFIGRHLVRRFVSLGAAVHGCARTPDPGPEGVTWHPVDVGDETAVSSLVDEVRPTLVYHLASRVAGSRDRELVLPTFRANLASTVYLLDAVARTGSCRRFLQAGSLEEPEPGEPIATPASPYAAAKWAASRYCRMFHRLYDLPVTVARLFMVYGPGQRDLTKLLPYLILRLLQGTEPMLSSGKRPVDWIYVEDVVDGLVACSRAPGLEGRRIDLGSGKLVPIRTVVETIYDRLAPGTEPPFGTLPDRTREQVRVARAEDTAKLLGWSPDTSLQQGLEATIAWYREAFESGRLEGQLP